MKIQFESSNIDDSNSIQSILNSLCEMVLFGEIEFMIFKIARKNIEQTQCEQ